MKDIKPFQLVFLGACLFIAVTGMLIFSFAGGKPNKGLISYREVVIWGTLDEAPIAEAIRAMNPSNIVVLNAQYIQKDEATFTQDLLEALADGAGPDVVLMPLTSALSYKSRITPIPFANVSERDFRNSFIEQGELYRMTEGYIALPFVVDPLVMYWNRDLFTQQNISTPPSTWEQVVALTPSLSITSPDLSISQSALSLGEYRNINNAKEILSTLILQNGNRITFMGVSNAPGQSPDRLGHEIGEASRGALSFYTQFANPQLTTYTWNRSLRNSQDVFAANNLAMYLGFGSEVNQITAKNPNLNFDMALLPQPASNLLPVTYGKLYGLSILSSSANKTGALDVISLMTGKEFLSEYALVSGLPPVRRDMLSNPPSDNYSGILYRSALYAKGWLDPNYASTDSIFQTMVDSVLSQGNDVSQSVQNAGNQLNLLVNDFNLKQNAN